MFKIVWGMAFITLIILTLTSMFVNRKFNALFERQYPDLVKELRATPIKFARFMWQRQYLNINDSEIIRWGGFFYKVAILHTFFFLIVVMGLFYDWYNNA